MQYEYIVDDKGRHYVPRLNSFCDARVRDEKIRQELGVDVLIVQPKVWSFLKLKYEVKLLG
jgi:hypothetical protein